MDEQAPKAEQPELTPEQQEQQVLAAFMQNIINDSTALGAMLGIAFQPEQLQAHAELLAREQLDILRGVVPTIQDLSHPIITIAIQRGEESRIVIAGQDPRATLQTARLAGPKLLDAGTTAGDVLASLSVYAMLFRPEFRMLLRAFGIQYGFAQATHLERPQPPRPVRKLNGRHGR